MATNKEGKPLEILKFADDSGSYKRQSSKFRNFISNAENSKFKPELNRYHLYVSMACPWAHRTLITRVLKGLTQIISVSVVHWHMDNNGWRFMNKEEASKRSSNSDILNGTEDHLHGFDRIKQLYFKADPEYSGRFTVPVLWDKKLETIVNNESSEILRMLNSEFNSLLSSEYAELDLYPKDMREAIDEINSWIYDNINNGVYKTGFSTKQEVYDKEVVNVFNHLDKVELILAKNHEGPNKIEFLLDNKITEADIRLFTTIVRFDAVYVQHFKCNLKMIRYDYPNIHNWLRLLYWKIPGFNETTDFHHIKCHYTKSHVGINPNGITPLGPVPDVLHY
jgi:putative glutathione S-transferase